MDSPTRPTRLPYRLPRAIVFCLIGGILVGAFTEWPVWLCVALVVGASVLLSGLLTRNRSPRRDSEPSPEEPGV